LSEDQPAEPKEAKEGEPVAEDERIRAELEEEIRKVRIEDLLLQSMVSVLNLSARRIAKEDERDLPQAKVGIDACRAIVDLLPEEAQGQVREALSELQMLYAKHAGQHDDETGDETGDETAAEEQKE
jgi:hypothetical protein